MALLLALVALVVVALADSRSVSGGPGGLASPAGGRSATGSRAPAGSGHGRLDLPEL